MGACRFMYQNLVTSESQLVVSSERPGIVGTAVKYGTGSAGCEASGSYTGTGDLVYTVQCDSTSIGTEVGQATFRWKDGTAATWNHSGWATTSVPLLLNNGIYVRFVAGSGADFVAGDLWRFVAVKKFGKAKLFDRDRNSEFRTNGLDSLADWIKVDLGAPRRVRCFILGDPNITAAASYYGQWGKLQANDADSWGSPSLSMDITWPGADNPACIFLDQTYRYWRFITGDPDNPDNRIRVSELYLGDYVEFEWLSPLMPSAKTTAWQETSSVSDAGIERIQTRGRRQDWTLRIAYHDAAQMQAVRTMFDALRDFVGQKTYPCWFTPRTTVPTDTFLMHVAAELTEPFLIGENNIGEIALREAVRAYV